MNKIQEAMGEIGSMTEESVEQWFSVRGIDWRMLEGMANNGLGMGTPPTAVAMVFFMVGWIVNASMLAESSISDATGT